MEQTLLTIKRLDEVGFKQIYLFDNSFSAIDEIRLKKASDKLHVFCSQQYTFKNKGLNEALLILNNIHHLISDQPVFKISGRYYPSEEYQIPVDAMQTEIKGIGYEFNSHMPSFNTRAYYVKNSKVLEQLMVLAVEEMIAYSRGVNGLRGLVKVIKRIILAEIGVPFQLSLEQAIGRILKAKKNYHLVNKLYIEGYIAGSDFKEFISE